MTGLETGYPSGHVLYRRLQKRYPRIVRGEGCWLEDAGGRRYLDACSGALVTNLGHGNAEVARAVGEQAARLAYVNGTAFTHDAVEELAAEVAALSAQGLDRTLFRSPRIRRVDRARRGPHAGARSRLPASSTARAASAPGRPLTPPPGCEPLPPR